MIGKNNYTKSFILLSISAFFVACTQESKKADSITEINNINRHQVSLTPQILKSAQLEIIQVKNRPDQVKIITTGEIKADDNRVFHINSIVAGRLLKDNITLGKIIKRGDSLAVVQNLEVARTYGDYVHQTHQNTVDIAQVQARLDLAKKNAQRLSRLNQEGIVAEKDLLSAENQQKILEIDLKGLKEHQLHTKAEAKELLGTYGVSLEAEEHKGLEHIDSGSPIVSPRDGVVIKKNVTVGDVVSPSDVLYVIADLSQVWLDINVYDKDLDKIKEGQSVSFRSDSLPNTIFKGTINYIQPVAGDSSKTFLARAILPNHDLTLKPGMFGQVEISCNNNKEYPYLPDRCIQKYGDDTFVFVKQQNGVFDKRNIKLGNRLGDGYLIIEGISQNEEIVGNGSFKLKSELLRGCLQSLRNDANKDSFEICVVDNASGDDSLSILANEFPYVKVIANTENLGFSKACNQAIPQTLGEYVLLLNPDTIVVDNAVSKLAEYLDEHAECGAVGPKILNEDGTLQLACRRSFPSPEASFFRLTYLSKLFPHHPVFAKYNMTYIDPEQVIKVDALSGSCMMVRRSVVEKIGLLDEDIFMFGEDIDWCWRIKQAGWDVIYYPQAIIYHSHGASSRLRPIGATFDLHKGMEVFYRKHLAANYWPLFNQFVYLAIKLRALIFVVVNLIKGKISQPRKLSLVKSQESRRYAK